jgi:transcriptional regulator with GAF, ATPase, and Fis domain
VEPHGRCRPPRLRWVFLECGWRQLNKRTRAASKPAKARCRKGAPKAWSHRGSTRASRETEVARLTREREEALEQQTTTAKVLQVISSSPGNLDAAFETILASATRLCEASFGTLSLHEGDGLFRSVAMYNAPAAVVELRRREPLMRPAPLVLLAKNKQSFQVLDATRQIDKQTDPDTAAFVELSGARSAVVVPMTKGPELIGAIVVHRIEVSRFSDRQEEVLRNFAAQAVIAIENARLLKELRQRTSDLTESFEQQTATSEVLRVVSSSLGDLQPVFDAMLSNATKICAAKFGVLWLSEGERFRCVALHNAPSAFAAQYKSELMVRPASGTGLRHLMETREVTQVADMTTIQPYIERDPFVVKSVE